MPLMTTLAQVKATFRRIDRRRYPEVSSYSWDEIYGHADRMAPGGLFLAAKMASSLDLAEGETVLDLACGRGDSSLYLAREFGVRVVAVDLWTSATRLSEKARACGLGGRIVPLQLDVRRELPFAAEWFDAVFCMQAFHSFGGSIGFVRRLLRTLRASRRLCIGGTCFSGEFPDGEVPNVYRGTGGRDAEYAKYHSPGWWQQLFRDSGMVEILQSRELEDGPIMWEDEFLWSGERAGWSEEWFAPAAWLADQLLYGHGHAPYLTHFIATVERRAPTNGAPLSPAKADSASPVG